MFEFIWKTAQRGSRKANVLPHSNKTREFCFGWASVRTQSFKHLINFWKCSSGLWVLIWNNAFLQMKHSLPRQCHTDSVGKNSNNSSTNLVNNDNQKYLCLNIIWCILFIICTFGLWLLSNICWPELLSLVGKIVAQKINNTTSFFIYCLEPKQEDFSVVHPLSYWGHTKMTSLTQLRLQQHFY